MYCYVIVNNVSIVNMSWYSKKKMETGALLSSGKRSSNVGIWNLGGWTARFRSFGSKQIPIFGGFASPYC